MSSYPTDKNISYRKLDYYNQPIIVPFYIEHIMLVTHIISRQKIHFYIRQIFPFCLFCDVIPSIQGNA